MARINILVALALVALFVASFLGSGHADLYVNVIGLTIVISGTLAATVLSYPMDDIGAAIRVAHNSYASSPPSDTEIVDAMLDLAVRSRNHGVLALEDAEEEVTVGFLRTWRWGCSWTATRKARSAGTPCHRDALFPETPRAARTPVSAHGPARARVRRRGFGGRSGRHAGRRRRPGHDPAKRAHRAHHPRRRMRDRQPVLRIDGERHRTARRPRTCSSRS